MSLFYELCRHICRPFLHGRVWGREHIPPKGGVLLLSNHQSFLDPIIVGLPVPREFHFVARDTLFRNRYFRKLLRSLNTFPVKRDAADVGAMKEILRRLRSGNIVCVFPEATRSIDGRIAPLKGGVIAMAQRAGVPILPVVVEGLVEIWPKTRKLPRYGHYWVEFGPVIPYDNIKGHNVNKIAAELTDQMRSMQNELRQRVGRPPLDYNQSKDWQIT